MAEISVHDQLPLNEEAGHGYPRMHTFLLASADLALKSLMWALFIIWVAVSFFSAANFMDDILIKWDELTEGTIFGITGIAYFYLLFTCKSFC